MNGKIWGRPTFNSGLKTFDDDDDDHKCVDVELYGFANIEKSKMDCWFLKFNNK